MGGFFGTISKRECATDLFYGTDYNSHLGTRRGGLATYDSQKGFLRGIHSLENGYFRSRFEDELGKFTGNAGIGIISDTDAQPMLVNSHLGRFALVTVARVNNAEDLAKKFLAEGMYLTEFSSGKINITELVSLLIVRGKDFVEGIENVFREVKGSCSMLILTENGIPRPRRDSASHRRRHRAAARPEPAEAGLLLPMDLLRIPYFVLRRQERGGVQVPVRQGDGTE